MRVAVNVEQLLHRSPGGIGRYTATLVGLFPTLFPDDQVVPFAARHPEGVLRAAADAAGLAPIIALPLPRPLLYDAWHILGFPPLRVGAIDLVHAPSLAVPPRGRNPLVVTVHDVAPALFPDTFSRRGRRFHAQGLAAAARRADLVITVSESAAEEIRAYTTIDAARIRVVPNGLDTVAVTDEQRTSTVARFGLDDGPYVLWVGSMEPRKGVGTLVAAMARATAGRPGAAMTRLVLAGYPGWLSDGLIAPGDRDALGDRLRQLGEVKEADLWALYAGATVFALPSRHEGFGLPVLEAMSQGVPVVCSDIPALREVAGDAARFVPPGAVGAWAEALEDLLGNEAERRRLTGAGRARSHQFSWVATVEATRRVYDEARSAPPRGRPSKGRT